MTARFASELVRSWPPSAWREVTVLVAVSGGADSTALLRGLAQVQEPGAGRLIVAHFNHRLRGRASDQDEAAVRELAAKLGFETVCGQAAATAFGESGSSEASSRARRYQFFQQAAAARGARYVATAHTADDQVETVLHRILRGTGIGGLAGVPRTRALNRDVTLVRPMLRLTRADILQFLAELEQPFRCDGSNADTSFTRNRIRHQLLPLLANDFNPRVEQALLRLGHLGSEYQEAILPWANSLVDACCREHDSLSVTLDRRPLRDAPRLIVREALLLTWASQAWPQQSMDFERWNRLIDLLTSAATSAHETLPGQLSVELHGPLATIRHAS